MSVLQTGIVKCGNLWVWKLIEGILQRGGQEPRRFVKTLPVYELAKSWDREFSILPDVDYVTLTYGKPFCQVPPHYQAPIEDFEAYTAAASHVWSGSFCGPEAERHLARFGKVVYIVRDPRDCAVSFSHYQFTPYRRKYYPIPETSPGEYLERRLAPFMRWWARHAGSYLLYREKLPIHFIFYERLVSSFDDEARALADYLGFPLDAAALASLREETTVDAIRSVDPAHVRKGGWGEWKTVLTREQAARARSAAGGLLEVFGYEGPHGPGLPDRTNLDYVRKMVSRAERLSGGELVLRAKAYWARFSK